MPEFYITYGDRMGDKALFTTLVENTFPRIEEAQPGGIHIDFERAPEKEGYMPVYYVTFEDEEVTGVIYEYLPLPEPEKTQLEKAQARITELENRTKVLEYTAQTTGETLDVHEGAIVDVMKLALGRSPEEL
ncbi:hypothetical protein [Saccharibacillus sacchari]|uniref:Uncharacterized protein n=1 Tax=Saccharibacillus sacchari TaxID=456493 RepID=A0ACC6PIB2_9BACL